MRKPRTGEFVEIWEPSEKEKSRLELHLVWCCSRYIESKTHFRATHYKNGGILAVPKTQINHIIDSEDEDNTKRAREEFMGKTKKEPRYGY